MLMSGVLLLPVAAEVTETEAKKDTVAAAARCRATRSVH